MSNLLLSRFRSLPMHITLGANPWRSPLLVILLIPSPNLRVARYSSLMPDVMLIRPHAFLGFEVAA
jgi:hypothetical protein